MRARKLLLPVLGALLATTISACGGATRGSVAVGTGYGPPEPYYTDSGYRPGYAWVDGYWDWDGSRWNWVEGYWIADRAGYVYVQPGWYVSGGSRYYRTGHWSNRPAQYDRVRYRNTARRPYYQRPTQRQHQQQRQRPAIRDHRRRN